MTDLITRLRTMPRIGDAHLPDEAADELERQQAEITRLRAALADMADLYSLCGQILDAGHLNVEDLALLRAALKETP